MSPGRFQLVIPRFSLVNCTCGYSEVQKLTHSTSWCSTTYWMYFFLCSSWLIEVPKSWLSCCGFKLEIMHSSATHSTPSSFPPILVEWRGASKVNHVDWEKNSLIVEKKKKPSQISDAQCNCAQHLLANARLPFLNPYWPSFKVTPPFYILRMTFYDEYSSGQFRSPVPAMHPLSLIFVLSHWQNIRHTKKLVLDLG